MTQVDMVERGDAGFGMRLWQSMIGVLSPGRQPWGPLQTETHMLGDFLLHPNFDIALRKGMRGFLHNLPFGLPSGNQTWQWKIPYDWRF